MKVSKPVRNWEEIRHHFPFVAALPCPALNNKRIHQYEMGCWWRQTEFFSSEDRILNLVLKYCNESLTVVDDEISVFISVATEVKKMSKNSVSSEASRNSNVSMKSIDVALLYLKLRMSRFRMANRQFSTKYCRTKSFKRILENNSLIMHTTRIVWNTLQKFCGGI